MHGFLNVAAAGLKPMRHDVKEAKELRARKRLQTFGLDDESDPDFEIAFQLLAAGSRRIGEVYANRLLEILGSNPKPEKREALITAVSDQFKARYDVTVGLEWVFIGEEIALEVHRQGRDPAVHLAALSEAQVEEITVVYEGIEDRKEAIRIAAKISRLQALDAEILLTTVKHLQGRKHFEWVQNEVGNFNHFLGRMVKITTRKTEASQTEAAEAARQTEELVDLSKSVSCAAQSTADAMAEAAKEVLQLRETLDQVMEDLSKASHSIDAAISDGQNAMDSVEALSKKSTSIQSIAALIEDIADRSGILALNASIEAARAGEAGASFGVVALEMKNLAEQTSVATSEIFAHLDAIQDVREDALNANCSMLETFMHVSGVTQTVKNDVSTRSRAASQIAEKVEQTAQNASHTRSSIASINELAQNLAEQSGNASKSLSELSRQIVSVKSATNEFLRDLSERAENPTITRKAMAQKTLNSS